MYSKDSDIACAVSESLGSGNVICYDACKSCILPFLTEYLLMRAEMRTFVLATFLPAVLSPASCMARSAARR